MDKNVKIKISIEETIHEIIRNKNQAQISIGKFDVK